MTVVDDLVRVAVEGFGVTSAELRASSDLQVEVASAAGVDYVRREQWRSVAERLDQAHERAAAAHSGGSKKGPARCRLCDAPVRFVLTEMGKPMPLDPLPRPMGNVIMVPRGQSKLVAQVVSPGQLPVNGKAAYQAHFASCPDAAAHRRARSAKAGGGRGRVVELGPDCVVCRRPLAVALADAGETSHPMCDPAPAVAVERPTLTLLPGGGSGE